MCYLPGLLSILDMLFKILCLQNSCLQESVFVSVWVWLKQVKKSRNACAYSDQRKESRQYLSHRAFGSIGRNSRSQVCRYTFRAQLPVLCSWSSMKDALGVCLWWCLKSARSSASLWDCQTPLPLLDTHTPFHTHINHVFRWLANVTGFREAVNLCCSLWRGFISL